MLGMEGLGLYGRMVNDVKIRCQKKKPCFNARSHQLHDKARRQCAQPF
jgi:hypothetical protein